MPAQDLVLLVTLEAAAACIPADDVAIRVEHANRVVDNRFDEQPEALGIVYSRRQRLRGKPDGDARGHRGGRQMAIVALTGSDER